VCYDTVLQSDKNTHYQYFAKYDGIFITRIADTEQDESRFWGILLNFQYVLPLPVSNYDVLRLIARKVH
jgi:hypothetical protein